MREKGILGGGIPVCKATEGKRVMSTNTHSIESTVSLGSPALACVCVGRRGEWGGFDTERASSLTQGWQAVLPAPRPPAFPTGVPLAQAPEVPPLPLLVSFSFLLSSCLESDVRQKEGDLTSLSLRFLIHTPDAQVHGPRRSPGPSRILRDCPRFVWMFPLGAWETSQHHPGLVLMKMGYLW